MYKYCQLPACTIGYSICTIMPHIGLRNYIYYDVGGVIWPLYIMYLIYIDNHMQAVIFEKAGNKPAFSGIQYV